MTLTERAGTTYVVVCLQFQSLLWGIGRDDQPKQGIEIGDMRYFKDTYFFYCPHYNNRNLSKGTVQWG